MKSIEQIIEEKKILENKINELLNQFVKDNPKCNLDINWKSREISTDGGFVSKTYLIDITIEL